MPPFRDLTNLKFGKLTAKSKSHQDYWGRWYWLCECEDGGTSIVASCNLTSGHTKNRRESLEYLTPKGHKTKIYVAWEAMKQRCYNPKARIYKYYGARGITVCDEWLNSLQAFYDWATSNGCTENLSIDRVNNNGNYEPTNCRWATIKEQNNNKRTNYLIEYKGIKKTVMEWGEILNIKDDTLRYRIKNWGIEKAFMVKVRRYKRPYNQSL